MFLQAVLELPKFASQTFVLRHDMEGVASVIKSIRSNFPKAIVKLIDRPTNGQAVTADIGVDALIAKNPKMSGPITFAACDNGVLYDQKKFFELLDDQSIDLILWGVRGYPGAARRPEMYGWIESDGDDVRGVSVKRPLSDPKNDAIITGTFTFRSADIFRRVYQMLIEAGETVNGEYYLDSLVNMTVKAGMTCKLLEVDSYLSWGTPDELSTFQYWQSCFHKWRYHPYNIYDDRNVPSCGAARLAKQCEVFHIQPSNT